MNATFELGRGALVGIGATAFMDLWLAAMRRLGMPGLDFRLLGRWVGHLPGGRFVHPAIAGAAPVRHEAALGWALHYATGIAFAWMLVAMAGSDWLARPTPGQAVLWGGATVLVPLLLLQPALGLGIAARHTAAPWRNRLRSLANHLVFGLGLYLAARLLALVPTSA